MLIFYKHICTLLLDGRISSISAFDSFAKAPIELKT
jgi:hypothetical protein